MGSIVLVKAISAQLAPWLYSPPYNWRLARVDFVASISYYSHALTDGTARTDRAQRRQQKC